MLHRFNSFRWVLVVISVFLWGVWGVGAQDETPPEAISEAIVQVVDGGGGEWITVALFGVLLVVVIVLAYLLGVMIPLLHESVSRSNLTPLYDALLPLAKQSSGVAYDTLIAELRKIANRTTNEIDNVLLAQLEAIVDRVVELEADKRASIDASARDGVDPHVKLE